jgi:hypothetical protein
MFFPATFGDEVVIDPDIKFNYPSFASENQSMLGGTTHKYLEKSTIIMCNPNALIYQWMITSANAYWLDFFLRRECNVVIWNYRGYGQSE